jgi:hypothetical protein
VRENERVVGGEEWQEKYITERNSKESSHSAHTNGINYHIFR